MKKLLLISLMSLASIGVAHAQKSILNNPQNKAYFGARLSIDASIPGDVKYTVGNASVSTDPFGTGGGLSVGGVYNVPIVANLYVEPGVDFYYHTNSINVGNFLNEEFSNNDFKNRSLRKFGMRIPVQLGYHFDFSPNTSFAVYTGPVLNLGFSNDYYLTTKEKHDIEFHESGSMYDEMNRADLSWRIGVGVNFLKNYYVGLSGDIGMLNMMKNKTDGMKIKMHENGFQLTLGYNFK